MKAIELFAGAGGAALGLEAAGVHHVALCEWDADACATLRAAGLGPVVEGDVRDLDAIASAAFLSESDAWRQAGDLLLDSPLDGDEWCLEREALATDLWQESRRLDLLWSSFPCQAWSVAGQRKGATDERNGWPWTVDAIDRFRPRWFIGENVFGLLHHNQDCDRRGLPEECAGCYFERVILVELRKRFPVVGWFVVDAADFGVPQHRRRLFMYAGPEPVTPPRATHGPGMFTRPWVSMGEALDIDWSSLVSSKLLREPSPTVTTTEVKGTRANKNNNWSLHRGADRASDVLAISTGYRGGDTGRRRLTVAECATLQGFPDGHPWHACRTKTARYRAVGNAVPPKLAQVVVEAVLEADRKHQERGHEKAHQHRTLAGIVENADG
jgi:DNA (cytosine-5)-methyltransferase 1